MNSVSYSVASIVQSYDNNSREGINVMEKEDVVYVDITKQFPTPGYKVIMDRVLKNGDEYKVYFIVKPPEPDRVLPQIVTYKTLTMKISKKELGNPPYKFQAIELRMA